MHGGLNGYNMLRSPLRGALLASEVGTGKTLIYGTVLLMEYYRLKALEANKQPVKAYPSIIVMPSSLVAQTFAELHNTFHDLRFYVWYDTAGGVSTSDPRRERTLTQATFDALMDDCIRNRHSSETAQVVVIAAHTTVTSRWAKQSTDFSRLLGWHWYLRNLSSMDNGVPFFEGLQRAHRFPSARGTFPGQTQGRPLCSRVCTSARRPPGDRLRVR